MLKVSNIAPFSASHFLLCRSMFFVIVFLLSSGRFIQYTPRSNEGLRVHIIIGTSALQLIRCIRSQGLAAAREWFPEVEPPAPVALLPGQEAHAAHEPFISADIPASLFEESLADAEFPFDAVVANKSVDYSYVSGSETLPELRPLELGIFDAARKTYRQAVHTKTLRPDLPHKALIGAGKHLCFASPELVVIQLASKLEAAKLAQVIMELTGFYTHSPAQDGPSTFSISPVTSIARIEALARRAPMMRGRAVLRAALAIAHERSASPMESILSIMLQLPLEAGGYEYSPLLVNPRIQTPENARSFASQNAYYPDIYLQSSYVDIEYESAEFHLDPLTANWATGEFERWRANAEDKAARDRVRTRELQALGVHVVPVTSYDMRSRARLDSVAWAIAQQAQRLQQLDADSYMEALNQHGRSEKRSKLLRALMKTQLIV